MIINPHRLNHHTENRADDAPLPYAAWGPPSGSVGVPGKTHHRIECDSCGTIVEEWVERDTTGHVCGGNE